MSVLFRRDLLVLIAALLFVPVFILAQFPSLISAPKTGSTTISPGAAGVGLFFELKNSLQKNSASRLRRPLLEAGSLQGIDSYFLLSPQISPSDREAKLLKEWVRSGGTLVLSYLNDEAYQRVQTFILDAGIVEAPEPMSAFENGGVTTVSPTLNRDLLKAGESYDFYSYLNYQGPLCPQEKQPCYVLTGHIGFGRVIVFAGLVPFSNGLIGHSNNSDLAARLAVLTKRSVFDEYHLMISEKTLSDLFSDPQFALPIAGFLIGLLIFFFFGNSDFNESAITAPTRKARRSFHALNRNLVEKVVLTSPSLTEAGEFQRKILMRLIPEARAELDQIAQNINSETQNPLGSQNDLAFASTLIEFHKNWLKTRGRK